MFGWDSIRQAIPRAAQIVRTRSAARLRVAADRYRDEQSWAAAARRYGLALRLRPDQPHLWVQYGHALKESGAREDAVVAYRRAAGMVPDDPDAHVHLGWLLNDLGRPAEAVVAMEAAALLDPSLQEERHFSRQYRRRNRPNIPGLPSRIRYLQIGSTNICNASCIHCPTNKNSTDHIARGPMEQDLHRKLFLGIYELGLTIHQISFGLFGDSLVDPKVVERAKFARALFPESEIVVNTNGAAFNAKKHAALREAGVLVSLHCESLIPEVYDDLMQPLRLKRVLPKFQPLIDTFPGKVHVSVPVNRRNLAELADIRSWFLERGARSVTFDPLVSRCVEDRTLFNTLAIRPGIVQCGPEILEDLIVDADGTVLLCCQDFERVEVLGDLSTQSVAQALTHARRLAVMDTLAKGEHACMKTCSKCFGDYREGPEFLAALPA